MSVKHAKPNLSHPQASEMVKRLFRLTPSQIRSLPSYDDQNFYVAAAEGGEFVLKVMNSEDSKNSTIFEVQNFAMSILHHNGLPAQTALPNISGELMSLEEIGYYSHSVQHHRLIMIFRRFCAVTLILSTYCRLWLWLSEVPGAAVDLFTWDHYFQCSFNIGVTV